MASSAARRTTEQTTPTRRRPWSACRGRPAPPPRSPRADVHSLALTTTGQLYAFGNNNYGQLGNATNNGNNNANPTPTQVSFPAGTIARIVAGGNHNLILTSTGQLYAFGRNRYGELGNTANNGTETANPTPAQINLPGANGSIAQIATGFDQSLVLTSTGQLFAFGYNQYGQLGSAAGNSTSDPNPTPTPGRLPGRHDDRRRLAGIGSECTRWRWSRGSRSAG